MSDSKLNYEQFKNKLFQRIDTMIPETVAFTPMPVQKNNGIIKNGIGVQTGMHTVTPVIYPDDYYTEYLNGSSMEYICEQIVHTICEYKEKPEEDICSTFFHYENARKRIVCRLINYEKNRSQLESIPHIPFFDLAIVFYLLLDDSTDSRRTALITDSLAESWKITCKQLYQQALENGPELLPQRVLSMQEALQGVSPGIFSDFVYILSNSVMLYGAACVLYKDTLRRFAEEIQESYYIIPSSIHEVLLCPMSAGIAAENLIEIISEVNRNVVDEGDFLSDNLYLYKQEENRLIMVSRENVVYENSGI